MNAMLLSYSTDLVILILLCVLTLIAFKKSLDILLEITKAVDKLMKVIKGGKKRAE